MGLSAWFGSCTVLQKHLLEFSKIPALGETRPACASRLPRSSRSVLQHGGGFSNAPRRRGFACFLVLVTTSILDLAPKPRGLQADRRASPSFCLQRDFTCEISASAKVFGAGLLCISAWPAAFSRSPDRPRPTGYFRRVRGKTTSAGAAFAVQIKRGSCPARGRCEGRWLLCPKSRPAVSSVPQTTAGIGIKQGYPEQRPLDHGGHSSARVCTLSRVTLSTKTAFRGPPSPPPPRLG